MGLIDLKGIFRKDFIIGLDIGTTSVKFAQFQRRDGGFYLVRADLKEIRQADNEAIREKEIVGIIKELLGGAEELKSQVIVSINCPHTAVKKVILPCMPTQELQDCVSMGAKNYFPFPVNNSLLDSEVSGEILEKGIKKYEAIVAVSPKTTIDKYLSLLGKAGVTPISLIPAPITLQRLVELSHAKEIKISCLVDIGGLYTELVILRGKNLVFSRKIPIAGGDFTKAMTGALVSDRGRIELTLEEAEKIKQEVGIPSETESKIINDKISTAQILSMLRTPLSQLVNEIGRCLDYYREESGGGQIESLILFGAGSSLKGLTNFLSNELGIEVRLGDPLEGLKVGPGAIREKDRISHSLAMAIGAGLSGARGGINLLPPELKEKTKRLFKRTTLETTVSAVILTLVFLYIGMKISLGNYQKKATVAKLELSSLEPQLKQAAVFSLLNDEPYWKDVFKELSNIIPNDIYITKLSMRNRTITIKGIAPSGQAQERISNFIVTLQKGMFNNVKLVSTREIQGKPGKEFVLNCWVHKE